MAQNTSTYTNSILDGLCRRLNDQVDVIVRPDRSRYGSKPCFLRWSLLPKQVWKSLTGGWTCRLALCLPVQLIQFSGRWYIYALGTAHIRSTPSQRFPQRSLKQFCIFLCRWTREVVLRWPSAAGRTIDSSCEALTSQHCPQGNDGPLSLVVCTGFNLGIHSCCRERKGTTLLCGMKLTWFPLETFLIISLSLSHQMFCCFICWLYAHNM